MNKSEFDQAVSEFQEELEQWARMEGHINEEQHVFLCAIIMDEPPVISAGVREVVTKGIELLEMEYMDFFTTARLIEAEVPAKTYLEKIRTGIGNLNFGREKRGKSRIKRVKDLLELRQHEIISGRGGKLGPKTFLMMRKVLQKWGMDIRE